MGILLLVICVLNLIASMFQVIREKNKVPWACASFAWSVAIMSQIKLIWLV